MFLLLFWFSKKRGVSGEFHFSKLLTLFR